MDENLNFFFDYNIKCPDQKCFLNFTFIRHTKTVNPFFTYEITIDYLVSRGIMIANLNMTSYQEHFMMSELTVFDENNQRMHPEGKLPRNNKDALRIMLFPNGWSNVTRTGRVVYMFNMGNEMYMYVVHYMEDK